MGSRPMPLALSSWSRWREGHRREQYDLPPSLEEAGGGESGSE